MAAEKVVNRIRPGLRYYAAICNEKVKASSQRERSILWLCACLLECYLKPMTSSITKLAKATKYTFFSVAETRNRVEYASLLATLISGNAIKRDYISM